MNSTPTDTTPIWKIAGIVATLVIVLALPLYRLREANRLERSGQAAEGPSAAFVGSRECRDCHRKEYDLWEKSHHRWAMAPATEESVLGDFSDATFEHFGTTSRFYRKDGKFWVHTAGPGGNMGDFEITHTFGWFPLQQYLIPFGGGRMQCLPIAWDVREKRWYHLYPDREIPPDDWLYWTNHGQNWNGMCAECHSTDLKKNYDPDSDTYHTTWSEISVGCEACHGPGSAHVAWAKMPEMGRPQTENFALSVRTADQSAGEQIQLCAPCHARRMSLDDNIHAHADFLDYGIPQLLSEGMYFADGQILEEVYVYGSFLQSKMYARDVRCSDCHDVHGIRRVQEGNDLCLQCHKAAVYDTKDHHFHKKPGEKGEPIRSTTGKVLFDVGTGAQCEQCHMPGRTYMGIDYRPDHSFRIPRPDLTLELGTPNACDRCHVDKTTQWSVDAMAKWYGQKRRPHYGTVLARGRSGDPEAAAGLIRLSEDRLYPTIVRATALSLLAAFTEPEETRAAFERALADEESLVRYAAVQYIRFSHAGERVRTLTPMLYDPVKAVRTEAARRLAPDAENLWRSAARKPFESALAEYRAAMLRTADFAASRHNLGNLCADLGDAECALDQYRKAIAIDGQFFPAKVNLAMLYNRLGENDRAEKLLREVLDNHPDLHDVRYSLGLLLAEKKDFDAAAHFMADAAAGLPQRHRIHYNLGLVLQRLDKDDAAERSLRRALTLAPGHPEYLYALAVFYLQRQRFDDAMGVAEQMMRYPATRSMGEELVERIRRDSPSR
ncbi:MAG: tetratricopeptide repeat protein [Desulfobacteraceae bacterium]|nr:tetratricopeptide repeat protein [Desulfobacteraceae bacterium]